MRHVNGSMCSYAVLTSYNLSCLLPDTVNPPPPHRCRGQEPFAHLGLWPLFSMVNHSCAPNASPLVLGNRLVLRACTPIAQGSEVCINYAGDPTCEAAPAQQLTLAQRQAVCELVIPTGQHCSLCPHLV